MSYNPPPQISGFREIMLPWIQRACCHYIEWQRLLLGLTRVLHAAENALPQPETRGGGGHSNQQPINLQPVKSLWLAVYSAALFAQYTDREIKVLVTAAKSARP